VRRSAIISLLGLLFGLCGRVQADSVTCDIPSPLTGSCSSQATAGVTVTGSASVSITGPGAYTPTPDEYAFLYFPPGPVHYIASYSFGISLTNTGSTGNGSITLTTTIPNDTGLWALYGFESQNPFTQTGNGGLSATNSAGFHGGLGLCADAGCEGLSSVILPTAGLPLHITFTESINSPNSTFASVTMLEIATTPEPVLWPVLLLPLGLLLIRSRAIARRR
jgi:hypothetical protein